MTSSIESRRLMSKCLPSRIIGGDRVTGGVGLDFSTAERCVAADGRLSVARCARVLLDSPAAELERQLDHQRFY